MAIRLFSVVIPLFNKRPYIRRAVDSVLSQTVGDYELIVVDDGSNDGSAAQLDNIDDERLKVITQENRGEGPARNTGMAAARGRYIAFLDADDAWLPGHLAELKVMTEKFPQAGMLATAFTEVISTEIPSLSTYRKVRRRQVDYFLEAGKKIGVVWSGTAAIRADVFGTIGGFINVRAGADLEYWARVALDYPVAVSDKVTSLYFRGTGGVMETIALEKPSPEHLAMPTRLQDISPSVAMLFERAAGNQELLENPSIHYYINGRLATGIPGIIYRGEYTLARRAARLMKKPLAARHLFYLIVSELPDWFLEALRLGYRWLNNK